jgi:hypothetical protein
MKNIFFSKSLIAYFIIAVMIVASIIFKDREIILPEMSALAIGCLVYQNPVWLSRPLHIFLLPSLTAVLGFFINRLDFSLAQKLILVLMLMVLILRIFKSHLAPALATGLLPIITNSTSYSFIISILSLTLLLSLSIKLMYKPEKVNSQSSPQHYKNGILYMVFISVWIIICSKLQLMFMAVIPPVIVVGYESVNKEMYSFKVLKKQVACLFLAAFVGTKALYFLDNLLLVAVIDIVAVSLILHFLKFKLPPAYAMALLPMVLHNISYNYFYLQVLILSIIVFGTVYLYKNWSSSKKGIFIFNQKNSQQ